MSITAVIEDQVNRGDLIVIKPLVDSDPQDRLIFVTPEIYNMLVGPWQNAKQEIEWFEARAIMDSFVAGRLISTSSSRNKDVQLKLLDTSPRGLWELRATKPKPGIRLLGLFAKKDCLIILNWRERPFLTSRRLWSEAFRECKAKWNGLFYTYGPMEETNCDDYISNIHNV